MKLVLTDFAPFFIHWFTWLLLIGVLKWQKKVIKIRHKKGKWHCQFDIIESSIASQFTEFVFSAKVWNYHAVEALACRAKAPGRTFGVFAHEHRLQASSSLPPKIPRWFIWGELFFITRICISLQNSWLARCSVRWTQTGEKMFGYSWWPGRRFCWHVWLSRPSRESGILLWTTLSDTHLTTKFVTLFAFILSQPVRVQIHLLPASFSIRGKERSFVVKKDLFSFK